jgi:O-methyltransferase
MMGLLNNQRFQRLVGGTVLERLGVNVLSRLQMVMLSRHKPREVLQLLRRVGRERTSLMTGFERFTLYSSARAYCRLPGDLAEVGVFQGVSAKLLCTVKGNKALHLFDTFEGLPKSSPRDGNVHSEKAYACSLESVRDYLKDYENVYFYKGLFPASAANLGEREYCFVNIDVDLYESTLACLQYFYPRMAPGGVILSHDYSLLVGVKAAFDEFLKDKPEPAFELPTSQCMLVKLPHRQ